MKIMYVIGLLIMLIGVIPAVLGVFFKKVFKETQLATPLSIFMILVFIWQVDIGVLYFHEFLSHDTILFLFKLFRGSILFVIPLTIYIVYFSYSRDTYKNKEKTMVEKIVNFVISKPVFIFTLIMSIIAYLINWTGYGVTSMYLEQLLDTNIHYYYPTSQLISKSFLFGLAVTLFIVLVCSYLTLKYISNKSLRQFMKTFVIFSFLLIVGGIFNLEPTLGSLVSSIFVVAFTTAILIAFVRMYITQLHDYNKLIQREMKLDYLGSLSASLIHEIRNPLHHIKNYSYILSKTLKMDDDSREFFSYIEKSTEQLKDIVESFTDYIDTKQMEIKKEDLNEVIEHAIDLTRANLEEHRVEIKFHNKYEQVIVPINKAYITQVFVNLIKNSAESIPEDRESRFITISIESINDSVEIDFKDTGKGIPTENWENIFNPFISNKKRGMGLGLAFSKKIVLEHQGDLKVVDSNPEGTHFRISIPMNTFFINKQ